MRLREKFWLLSPFKVVALRSEIQSTMSIICIGLDYYIATVDRFSNDLVISVHTALDQACIASQSLAVPPSTGYLANIITDGTGKGASPCPWRFQLLPEQTMNLTLLDFGIYGRNSNHVEDARCLIYAVIKERLPSSSSSSSEWSSNLVCGGDARKKLLLPSVTKEVQIEVKKLNGQQDNKIYFLIRYDGWFWLVN